MRIAFVSDAYVPVPTGVAVSLETLRLSLERLGHTVYIFAPEFRGFHDQNKHVSRIPATFYRSDQYRPKVWPFLTRINKNRIAKLKLDIVHSHFFFDHYDLAPRIAKLADAPLVHSLYRIFPESARKKSAFASAQGNASREITKITKYANSCDQLIALSKSSKKYYEDLSINAPIEVLPVGIFTKDFASLPTEAIKDKFKIPQNRKLVLHVTRADDESNLLFLIRSFKRIWKAIDEVHLLIIGGGRDLKFYEELVARQPFAKYITFTGFMGKSKVNKVYGSADLMVYPKTLDPQPLCIIESLAAGTPVVAVKGYGAQDFIEDGIDGLISTLDEEDFSDKVIELLRRDKMRLEFSLRARSLSRQYSSSNLTQDLVNLYDCSINNRRNKIL